MIRKRAMRRKRGGIPDFLSFHKTDIAFAALLILLSSYYVFYGSATGINGSTGVYIDNARSWLTGAGLFDVSAPPMVSWLIAGAWLAAGESLFAVKLVSLIFAVGSGIILYAMLRRYKGGLFAFGVAAMSMLNAHIFFNAWIYADVLSLFFVVAMLHFLKSETPNRWFLAGAALGLAFASQYIVAVPALAILFAESFARKNWRLVTRTAIGALPVIAAVVLAVFLKSGVFYPGFDLAGFGLALTPSLILSYVMSSANIWGLVFLLVPLAFLFRSTYVDRYNYAFFAWLMASIMLSGFSGGLLNAALYATPAVYFLAMLGAEGIVKHRIFLDSRITKDFLSGIISLVIILAVTYLYFSNFSLSAASPLLGSRGSASSDAGYNFSPSYFSYSGSRLNGDGLDGNLSRQFFMPTKKVIIIRMDDVQAWAWNKITPNITDTVLNKGMPIALGVIPKNIERDVVIKNYLVGKSGDPNVEIAQHGTYHAPSEFKNLSEAEAYELAKEGFDKLMLNFRVYPVTFIPPNNEYSEESAKALSRLGFKILSAEYEEYKSDGSITYVGYTKATKDSSRHELTPVSEVMNSCQISLQLRNICVVLLHPQDFANDDKVTINEERYAKFVGLLDELKTLDAEFVNFRDLVK